MNLERFDETSDSDMGRAPRSIGLKLLGAMGMVLVWFAVVASIRGTGGLGWYTLAYTGLVLLWSAGCAQQHRDRKAGRKSRDALLLVLRLASIPAAVIVAWQAAQEFAL